MDSDDAYRFLTKEKLEVVDVPEKNVEKEKPKEDAETMRKSFTPEEVNELRRRIQADDLVDEESILKRFKNERISRIRTDTVSLSEVFVFCKDMLDTLESPDELVAKLKKYAAFFDDLDGLRHLVEEYGEGDKYNDHLYIYEMQKMISSRRKEVVNFVYFTLGVVFGDEVFA